MSIATLSESSSISRQTVLTSCLRGVLSTARAECVTLPDVPEIKLFLLNVDFSSAQLTAAEMRAVLNYPAYWAFCWASGQVLARYLLDHPSLVRGKTVLDFGCGSGVVAIAAAKAGAARVFACDIDVDARLATKLNAELNGVELELIDDYYTCDVSVDIILAADVLYDRANLAWLPLFLRRAEHVLLADSRVRNFSVPDFCKIAELSGSTWPDLDEFDEFRVVRLYEGRSVSTADNRAAPAAE